MYKVLDIETNEIKSKEFKTHSQAYDYGLKVFNCDYDFKVIESGSLLNHLFTI